MLTALSRKHVFQDLRPYVCTFRECDLKMFPDRATWFEHEMQSHRLAWQCPFCPHSPFESLAGFKLHLQKQHSGRFTEAAFSSLAQASQRSIDRVQADACPFCLEWANALRKNNPDIKENDPVYVTPAQFRHHVSGHMEQLALFAIPRGYLEEGEEGESNQVAAGTSSASRVNSSMLSKDSLEGSEFLRCVHDREYSNVRRLIDQNVDVNVASTRFGTALHMLAVDDSPLSGLLMIELLSASADVSAVDTLGNTPLHSLASIIADFLMVSDKMSILLSHGANINTPNQRGQVPLHLAATRDPEIVTYLLSHGAAVDLMDYGGNTPLHLAVYDGRRACVTRLLSHDADPNVLNQLQETPFFIAVSEGSTDTVSALLSNGALPDIANLNGDTALHQVVASDDKWIAAMLVGKGLKIDVTNKRGETPLFLAAKHDMEGMTDLLLQHGAEFRVWLSPDSELKQEDILLALDNLAAILRRQRKYEKVNEVQQEITKLEGGLHAGVAHPYMSGSWTRAYERFENINKRIKATHASTAASGSTLNRDQDEAFRALKAPEALASDSPQWLDVEREQLQLVDQRKNLYGEGDRRTLTSLDMLGALYQDWLNVHESEALRVPGGAVGMEFGLAAQMLQGLRPKKGDKDSDSDTNSVMLKITEKMFDLASKILSRGSQLRSVELFSDVAQHRSRILGPGDGMSLKAKGLATEILELYNKDPEAQPGGPWRGEERLGKSILPYQEHGGPRPPLSAAALHDSGAIEGPKDALTLQEKGVRDDDPSPFPSITPAPLHRLRGEKTATVRSSRPWSLSTAYTCVQTTFTFGPP